MAANTETAAIADLATVAASQVIAGPDGRSFLVTANNCDWVEISDPHGLPLGPPRRIRQRVVLQTLDSLVDYADRFKTAATVLMADMAQNAITVPLDYHAPDAASNVEHVAAMSLPFSEEWKTWTGVDGKLMAQLEFARFIEENAADVSAPTGADLLEVVRDLQATRRVDFTRAVRTASDSEDFEYSDSTDTRSKKGNIEVPSRFELLIPVYFGEGAIRLDAFLRWRLQDTTLLLGVALHRAEYVRQAVFRNIVADAANRIDRPAMFGKLVNSVSS